MTLADADAKYLKAKYSPAELRGDELPFGVDGASLDDYVTDEDFKKSFGHSREDYFSLPKWKQTEVKRKSGLF